MSETTSKKRKLSLPLVLAGGVSSLVLALGMSPTFSAFTASITNNANNASAGTLVMSETGNSKTCFSSDSTATCTTINKYGGLLNMKPGDSTTTNIVIANTGNVDAASFSLTPLTCVPTGGGTGAGDLCGQLKVAITQDDVSVGTPVTPKLLTATSFLFTTVKAKASTNIAITVSFPSTGDNATDNSFQGTQASQQLTWTFQS
jgi:hypothetical protein